MKAPELVAEILARFGARGVVEDETARDQATLLVPREWLIDVARRLRDAPDTSCEMLLDIAGVDFHKREDEGLPRFEVVYHLYSLTHGHRVRLKVRVSETDPQIPTLMRIYPAADWFEREAHEMFGVVFAGHPNLKKLLLHEAFQGHPLRKDYDPTKRWPLASLDQMQVPDLPTGDDARTGMYETVTLNLGPSHPATHGTIRISANLDGEIIVSSESEIGYLHRCFEKMAETHTWNQVIPYTDRLNYCSSFMNNVGYTHAVERMLGVTPPPRAQAIEVILSEFSRIMDHAVCVGTGLVDLGGLTNFWYLYQPREEIYTLIEACCGARLTTAYTRIGGLAADVPAEFVPMVRQLLASIPKFVRDVEKLILENRIFRDRTAGVCAMSRQDAIAWGFTGPCGRASGIDYDVRKAHPYLGYENYEFDVPVFDGGDIYDRYQVRLEEIWQSLRIIRQAVDNLPAGPVLIDDYHIVLPPKSLVYNTMEGLIYHFELIMNGIQVPRGEIYSMTEAANGELGFYIVSDGGGRPHRIKVRPPCFPIFSAYGEMVKGRLVSDAVANLGSLNVVVGELDR